MPTKERTQNDEAPKASPAIAAPTLKVRAPKLPKASLAQAAAKAVSVADPLPLGELRIVKLAEILVENRARKDLGDLEGLARSLAETGLAQPPLVDAQMRLVCGHRRVEAARSLGWTEIAVRVLDIEDPLALMVAEDANRKDLTASEKYSIAETLRGRAEQEGWRKRAFGGRLDAAHAKGRLDEEIGRALRLSRETLRKIRAVHQAAQDDPTKFGDLTAKLDQDGRVDRHYRELERRQGRGDASRAAAILVLPGWAALYDVADAKEVGRYAKAALLQAGADVGTALLLPSSVAALGEAASLLRQGGFEWRTTLRGSGATGEELWLVGVAGRGGKLPPEAVELLAEGCAQGADAAAQAAEVAFDGDARPLDLGREAGS